MVIIVKLLAIDGLSKVKIMLYWWTTFHLQAQYAAEVYYRTDASMTNIKATYSPEDELRYCPAFLAG